MASRKEKKNNLIMGWTFSWCNVKSAIDSFCAPGNQHSRTNSEQEASKLRELMENYYLHKIRIGYRISSVSIEFTST